MALEQEAEAAPRLSLIVGYSGSVTTPRVGLTPKQQGTFYNEGCLAQCVKTQSCMSS